jgi:protoporphyrinogen oxidase
MTDKKTAVIIGAGPAGLTAAYELLTKTDIKPIVLEASDSLGGISRTVEYKGNRIDIGGHRFFSKSDRVMQWWQSFMPIQGKPSREELQLGVDTHEKYAKSVSGPDPEKVDLVMLLRQRLSRIFFLRRFFDYPVTLSVATVLGLGPLRMMRIFFSYLRARLAPIRPEKSLEDFFINRFGRELYLTFFKDYTEKVWGRACSEIKPEWGAQRVKGLSITKTLLHALKSMVKVRPRSLSQKDTETSLIEQFLYPKLGPGQLWEEVARQVRERGGEVLLEQRVVSIRHEGGKVLEVEAKGHGGSATYRGDFFISTMPVKDLVAGICPAAPTEVAAIASELPYRDFITVGLLLRQLRLKNRTAIKTWRDVVPDNWIYIQERDVKVGRLQIFNNWSPYLVKDSDNVWVGMEYFCQEGDALWSMSDEQMKEFAASELEHIDIINKADLLDGVVLRVPKTYPAYFGAYEHFDVVRNYVDGFDNLFLVGRNGMHRYNNSDHSMLTAMLAVESIAHGGGGKAEIWSVNTEQEYHEQKADDPKAA